MNQKNFFPDKWKYKFHPNSFFFNHVANKMASRFVVCLLTSHVLYSRQ